MSRNSDPTSSALPSFQPLFCSTAFQESLELLEWPRLCEHLATFASTLKGQSNCINLDLPTSLEISRLRLAETIEIGNLDREIEGGLSLQGIHDLEVILARCSKGGVVSGDELLKVAETLAAARRLRRQIDDASVRPIITSLFADISTHPELEKLLKTGLEEGGRIADRASSKLSELRCQYQRLLEERRTLLQEIIRRYGVLLQDTVVADRHSRPVLAVKAGAIGDINGIVHDSSSSGNTLFVEPQLVIPLGNRIAEIQAHILEEEHLLLRKWSQVVGDNYLSLQHLCEIILKLDLALARARYGEWLGGVAPKFVEGDNAPFRFDDLRHPLLIWQQCREEGVVVVPITIEVPKTLKVVAITGPNTGGKTVTLKSVGLAVLMARAGLLVPCVGEPLLPWCTQVLADIGDEQSLEQSLSTFSGHLIRITRILKAINEGPGPVLVLLDEIGAGTDPSEGTALAIALLKTFADRARLTIATTHFGELKALKYSDSRFENASVAFDVDTLTPTYLLQWGIPGRSNALAIARRLGLDSSLIEHAQELIESNVGEDVNQVIVGLEEQRKRQQLAAESAATLLARTEILHEELLMRWKRHSEESAQLHESRRNELEISIREGQEEVRNLIRRLRANDANGETARRVGQRLRRLEKENSPVPQQITNNGWTPQVGDQIRLVALGKAGQVQSISQDGLHITVVCGSFRSTVSLNGVESLAGEKPITSQVGIKIMAHKTKSPSSDVRTDRNTVDVRGLRVHEAEVVVDEYLRKGVSPLWVIHGIGTGKLKKGLKNWLQSVPYVNRVNEAERIDGGSGCSVVWLD